MIGIREPTNLRKLGGVALAGLDEIRNVHWHLVDAGIVELFDVVQGTLVIVRHEIDRNTFATETATASNPGGKKFIKVRNSSIEETENLIEFSYLWM